MSVTRGKCIKRFRWNAEVCTCITTATINRKICPPSDLEMELARLWSQLGVTSFDHINRTRGLSAKDCIATTTVTTMIFTLSIAAVTPLA